MIVQKNKLNMRMNNNNDHNIPNYGAAFLCEVYLFITWLI